MTEPVLALTKSLIERRSVTPADEGCQSILADRLERLGFQCEHLRYGAVDNLYATLGSGAPHLMLLGHTDVVPTGPLDQWTSDPFTPTVRDGLLYGRGAADMKGSLAAMIVALETALADAGTPTGTLSMLVTSDEEGVAIDGVRRVMQMLAARGERIDYCLVGEPSSLATLGDNVRVGRRGSLNLKLTIEGVQGHVAYPELARNPVHEFARALAELVATEWDRGNKFFPPTSFQVSNLRAGTGATNVIPGRVEVDANFRYSPESTAEELQARVEHILERHKLTFDTQWNVSGAPFLTRGGTLVDAVVSAVRDVVGSDPELDTGGGTSDGRFVAPTGADVVELGPVNRSIHKIDEHVDVESLPALARMYANVVQKISLIS